LATVEERVARTKKKVEKCIVKSAVPPPTYLGSYMLDDRAE
jgi:hypothetical protein